MALIRCPECDSEVSDKAQTCPRCAFPIAQQLQAPLSADNRPIEVELTSKRLKMQEALAVLLVLLGMGTGVAGALSESDIGCGVSTLMVLVGFIWLVVVRVRVWWHHR
jgi:hypothetical protein